MNSIIVQQVSSSKQKISYVRRQITRRLVVFLSIQSQNTQVELGLCIIIHISNQFDFDYSQRITFVCHSRLKTREKNQSCNL